MTGPTWDPRFEAGFRSGLGGSNPKRNLSLCESERLRFPLRMEETPEQLATRLKGVVQEINDTLNVEGLCRAFKQRVQKLVVRDGDRISH